MPAAVGGVDVGRSWSSRHSRRKPLQQRLLRVVVIDGGGGGVALDVRVQGQWHLYYAPIRAAAATVSSTVRVQVPNSYIPLQNLYYNDQHQNPKYPAVEFLDRLGYGFRCTVSIGLKNSPARMPCMMIGNSKGCQDRGTPPLSILQ